MKLKLFFYHVQWPWQNEGTIEVTNVERDETENQLLITTFEQEVPSVLPLSPKQRVPRLVKILEAEKQKIQAEAFKDIKKVEDRIQELLCLTHNEEVHDD